MKSALFSVGTALISHAFLTNAQSQEQIQRGLVLAKGAIEPVVANATECGCATYITTLYGAMSSGPIAVLTTVSSTTYSTATVYVTQSDTAEPEEVTFTTYTTTTALQTVTESTFDKHAEPTNIASSDSSSDSTSSLSIRPPVVSVPASSSDQAVASASPSNHGSASLSSTSVIDGHTSSAAAVPPVQNLSSDESPVPAIPSTQAPPQFSSQAVASPQASTSPVANISSASASDSQNSLNPTNSKTWAISYSPVDANGHCKPSAQIQADIRSIAAKGFTTVRFYSPECSILPTVLPLAQSLSLQLILGIFVHGTDGNSLTDYTNQVTDIITAVSNTKSTNDDPWHPIALVVVANESLNQNLFSIDALETFLNTTRSKFRAAGYSGPVTTAETTNIWQSQKYSARLCAVCDIVAANIHPFFDPFTNCSSAGTFVQTQLDTLAHVCPEKAAINLETGWPHAGECDGEACPGQTEQKQAVQNMRDTVGVAERSVFFAWEDEVWKEPGDFGVERAWGLGELFQNVK